MHRQPFESESESAVRGSAVFVQHEVGFELLGVHSQPLHLFNLHVVIVYALPAGGNLYPAEQKVERKGNFGVLGVVHGVEGALFREVVRDEQKVAAVLLFCPLAEERLFLGLEVLHVGDVLKLFNAQLFCVFKAYAGYFVYLGDVNLQQLDFVCVLALQKLHNVFEHACLHLHNVGKAVYKAHLEVHGDIFVEVPARVVVLGAEYGAYLEHPFVYGHERLFVELGALRKEHGFAEVVEFEHVRAALGARKVYLRRMNFGKALAR